ncbi:hypothetical protein K439DRAFT_1633357 [Ramaria rubella]|nr:hypothetical protein K439DRAFT_1633357 [Ramaria rubella]
MNGSRRCCMCTYSIGSTLAHTLRVPNRQVHCKCNTLPLHRPPPHIPFLIRVLPYDVHNPPPYPCHMQLLSIPSVVLPAHEEHVP